MIKISFMKLLMTVLCSFFQLFGVSYMNNEKCFCDLINVANSFNLYCNGEKEIILNDNDDFYC